MIKAIRYQLKQEENIQKAHILGRFFKTEKGDYAEEDMFIGVTVPACRRIVKTFRDCPFDEVTLLLASPIHEERFVALQILVSQFSRGDEHMQKKIFDLYMQRAAQVNNWDLVDSSAPQIVGAYLYVRKRDVLVVFARSNNLWKKRIAIIATFYFLRKHDFADTLAIAEILLHDQHDLIHKAVGWMLREVGKRDPKVLVQFLKQHYKVMPRTMLRYAIEKFPEARRKQYLMGNI